MNTLLTHIQIFGIGFSFGIIGPCFLACTPMLITYVAGSKRNIPGALKDVIIFLLGRLSAYIILGYTAGLSAGLLGRFMESHLALYFKPMGGILSVFLGLSVLFNKRCADDRCAAFPNKAYNFGGLFTLGFIVGITPCPPLYGLLFEIMLISKSGLDGASYAASFGAGTFLSGLLAVGSLAGLVSWLPARFLKSRTSDLIFRIACGTLLILLGIGLILGCYSYGGRAA